MERSILMETIEDADTLFLIAKDRLLDVNEWSKKSPLNTTLIDKNGEKQHRNAHTGDHIKVNLNINKSYNMYIEHIIYDKYPDSNSEQITLSINKTPSFTEEYLPSEDDLEEIIIRRINHSVSAIAEVHENDHVFTQEHTSMLLSSFISIEEYEAL